jgi:PncC family amidohydrolase
MLDRLANEIIEHATVGGITIATAESCSAGRLAEVLAKAEGASNHYIGGVVAYTKQMKERMLGVPPQLLQEKTAVCGPVAEAMAIGVLIKSGATVAVSITGVAGPDEDEDGNPVGLVYCGVARNNNTHRHIRLKCRGPQTPSSKRPALRPSDSCDHFVFPEHHQKVLVAFGCTASVNLHGMKSFLQIGNANFTPWLRLKGGQVNGASPIKISNRDSLRSSTRRKRRARTGESRNQETTQPRVPTAIPLAPVTNDPRRQK